MTYVIAQPCVDLKDKACIEECPVDCIYEGERSLYIHPDECVDCGACEPVCPVEAIYYEDDVPEEWAEYYKANVEFFDDLGSPGGRRQARAHQQGPPDHRRPPPAGARRVSRPGVRRQRRRDRADRPPRLPLGLARPRTRSGRAGRPEGSSTSPSGPPSTRPPRSSAPPSARPPTRRGTRRRGGPPTCARPLPRGSPAAAACPASTRPASSRRSGARSSSPGCPTLLGLGPDDTVGIPAVAYPTYDVGARLAGARARVVDGLTALGPVTAATAPRLLWVNSPGNPTGKVLGVDHLAKVVAWARRHGVVVASDECYAELDWRDTEGGGSAGDGERPEHPRPAGLWRRPHRSPGRVLAEQAVQPRRVPGRVRRR